MESSQAEVDTASKKVASSNGVLFSDENFLRKLNNVTPTQDSIQSLALWIIHHKANHEVICKLWADKIAESTLSSKQRLALFYLANDVIQNCKRKNAKIFQESFKKHLKLAVHVMRGCESIKKDVQHVIDVWTERNVYEKEFTAKLTAKLNENKSKGSNEAPKKPTPKSSSDIVAKASVTPKPTSKTETNAENKYQVSQNATESATKQSENELEQLIANFQPKSLCETLSTFEALSKDVITSRANIESSRILDLNLDQIKQYKDRKQCENFEMELENSLVKLQEHIKKLKTQCDKRKQLVDLLKQSQLFYDAQNKDVLTVLNVYRIYGAKVHSVKSKLDEMLTQQQQQQSKTHRGPNEDIVESMDMDIDYDDRHHTSEQSSSSRRVPSDQTTNASIKTYLDPRNRSKSAHKYKSHTDHDSRSDNSRNANVNFSDKRSQSQKSRSPAHKSSSRSDQKHSERSTTPLLDENKATSNPNALDFLTKFISNSSSSTTMSSEEANKHHVPTSSHTESSNLSYIVNSLQKIVGNKGLNTQSYSNIPKEDSNVLSHHNVVNQLMPTAYNPFNPHDQIYPSPLPLLPGKLMTMPPPPISSMNSAPHANQPLTIDPNSYHPGYMYNQPYSPPSAYQPSSGLYHLPSPNLEYQPQELMTGPSHVPSGMSHYSDGMSVDARKRSNSIESNNMNRKHLNTNKNDEFGPVSPTSTQSYGNNQSTLNRIPTIQTHRGHTMSSNSAQRKTPNKSHRSYY